MNRWIANTLGMAGIMAIVLGIIGASSLNKHIIIAVDSYHDSGVNSGELLAKINAVIDAQTASCAGNGPCKSIVGNLNKTAVKVQDISVTTQRQVQQSSKLVNAASQSLAQTSQSIATVTATIPPVASQAVDTLQTARSVMRDLQPLERSLAEDSVALHQAITDTDKLIANPDIPETVDNVRATTKEFALISNDLHVYTHPYLNPDPCTNKKCRWGRILGKVGGYVALGAQAEQFGSFWKPLPVSIKK